MEPLSFIEIVFAIIARFWPVWLGMALIMGISYHYRARLSLYGRLYDSGVGLFGLALVLFWLLTALMADWIATYEPLIQMSAMKNKVPGTAAAEGYGYFLLGGDNLARDVFSRVVYGSQIVLTIAPAATLFAFMVGVSLGLPAGYYGGKIDTSLSFLANMVLAFPVILLFYLLVTPGIRETPIPTTMAGLFFIFPVVFFSAMILSRFQAQQKKMWTYLAVTGAVGGWVYLGMVFDADPLGILSLDPNELNIFVSVVFASSPAVFRIVRGLTLDIKTRDYVAAAQTRGEGPFYIMLWEILPNARGPLIVDACLRIGYTAILLGTLGFFGLGMAPESPDWGSTIDGGRKLLRLYAHPALPPALALMSLVLGLNMLADGLREQSLKD